MRMYFCWSLNFKFKFYPSLPEHEGIMLTHPRKLTSKERFLLIVNLPGPFRWCQTPGAKALCEYPGSNQSSASWEVDICK